MFVRKVQDNHFCSGVGDELFPHITSESYAGGDFSMTTVLRALLGDRTEEKVSAHFEIMGFAEPILLPENFHGLILVELPADPSEEAKNAMNALRGNLENLMPGFQEIVIYRASTPVRVSEFLEQQANLPSLLIQNKERRQTVAYIHGLNVRYLHLVESFLPRLLPWYFQEKPVIRKDAGVLDQPAMDLLTACSGRDYFKFEAAVAGMYARYEFRRAIIKSQLRGFETRLHENELANVRRNIENLRSSMSRLRAQIADLYIDLDRQTTSEAGLIEKIKRHEDGGGEIKDLFLTYKNLHLGSVDGTAISFIVDTVINNFDPDVFERTIENENSFWYRTESGAHYSRAWTDEQIKKFFKAIFLDEILKIKVCAAYRLDFANGSYRGLSGFNFGSEFADCMPNQHIQRYSCLGDGHDSQLYEAMSRRDYTGAVNVCIASAGNMSMQEVPTGELHMKYLLGDNPGKCIILPDGRNVAPIEALKWLESQESEGGSENE